MFLVLDSLGKLLNDPRFLLVALVLALPASALVVQKRDMWLRLWIAFASLQGIAWMLKVLVDRPRPPGFHGLLTPSFPSIVAADAGFAAVFLSHQWPRFSLFWHMLGIGLAMLRVYVDAHYVSDVVAGYLLGWVVCKAALRRAA